MRHPRRSLSLAGAAPFLAAFLAAASAPDAPSPPAQPIRVALQPSPWSEALRRLVLRPSAAAAVVTVVDATWDGTLGGLASADAVLVELDAATLQAGCASGRLARTEWPAALRDHLLHQAVTPCGLGVALQSTALAWDRDKLALTPEWGDFWDVARHPGKRGLQRTPRGNLEIALLADGVSPGDVYRVLAGSGGIDRAFRKLDQLRPYIVWWRRAAEPAALLTAGAVLLTSAPAERIVQAAADQHRGFGVTYAGSLYAIDAWALPVPATVGAAAPPAPGAAAAGKSAGSPPLAPNDTLRRLLDAGQDPDRLTAFARASGLAVADLAATARLATSEASAPARPDPVPAAAAGLQIDEAFWAANLDTLSARFDAWLAT